MPISLFQLFSIGIGPSSSHTVGPMRAARKFLLDLKQKGDLHRAFSLKVDLFGSLAMTGIGHGTDKALILGFSGSTPEGIDPNAINGKLSFIAHTGVLNLLGEHPISFSAQEDLHFNKGKRLPYHSNAMRMVICDDQEEEIFSQIYYSLGGGFILEHSLIHNSDSLESGGVSDFPYSFSTYKELQTHCRSSGLSIVDLVMENEKSLRSESEVKEGILHIWKVMQSSIQRGLHQTGILPGGLKVPRRAALIYRHLLQHGDVTKDPTKVMDWVSVYAMAVNEENAAGGRVVTAPTNGASGLIPAVLSYYWQFTPNPTEEGVVRFFLAAAAVAILFKKGASLSAAEMGCQGEVGVACSMAAAGLVAALEGSDDQIENAAAIGIKHNLGLTCDPVAGLVQVPCIERNTMGAVKAINAAKLSFYDRGDEIVTLDSAILSMRHTGEDMKSTYKETSEGGLALHVPVNLPDC